MKQTSVFLFLYFVVNCACAQLTTNSTLLIKIRSLDNNLLEAFNTKNNEHYVCVRTGDYIDDNIFSYNSLLILCADSVGDIKWEKKIPIDRNEKFNDVIFLNNSLYFFCTGYNKFKISLESNNIEIGFIKRIDLDTFKTTEYYFDERPYGFALKNNGFFVFTKDLGCKNIKSNLRMYHMNLGPNNLVDIGKSKVFDNLTCFNNKFNKSIMYFDKNNNLAYIKEDFAYKYKIDFVRKIEDMNKNNYWLTYSFVNYDFKNNIKKIDTLCKDCIIWSFKFLSQEKTIGVISDTSGNSIFIYNTITKNKKAISIAKGYDNFRIFTRDNEIVLVGTDRNGSNGLFVYLKDEKIIWEKNILLVYNNNKSDLVAFITKDEIIVNYLSIIANKSKESELYKIILTKSY